MSANACQGCKLRNEKITGNDFMGYLPYAEFLMLQLERLELGLEAFLVGFDSYFIPAIKREITRIQNKMIEEKYKKERE
jgi:hypothetical protein